MKQDIGASYSAPNQQADKRVYNYIQCAHGDEVVPTNRSEHHKGDGKAIKVEAGISQMLPVSVLLGTYVKRC